MATWCGGRRANERPPSQYRVGGELARVALCVRPRRVRRTRRGRSRIQSDAPRRAHGRGSRRCGTVSDKCRKFEPPLRQEYQQGYQRNMVSQAFCLRDVGASLLILGLSLASVTVAKADEPVSPPNSPDRSFRPLPPGWRPHSLTPK